jgi:hypothetical protein
MKRFLLHGAAVVALAASALTVPSIASAQMYYYPYRAYPYAHWRSYGYAPMRGPIWNAGPPAFAYAGPPVFPYSGQFCDFRYRGGPKSETWTCR